MNAELRRNAKKKKKRFQKRFFQVDKQCRKSMENVRDHRDIKLVTTKGRKSYLVLEPN